MSNNNNVYIEVMQMLQEKPETRDSDRLLYWELCRKKNLISGGLWGGETMNKEIFLHYAPNFEGVTRARRKVQELHKELRPTTKVEGHRKRLLETKGTFIFREPL